MADATLIGLKAYSRRRVERGSLAMHRHSDRERSSSRPNA